MVIAVQAGNNFAKDAAYTITGLIQAMRSDNPPSAVDFPYLSRERTEVSMSEGATIEISDTSAVVCAMNLITCASVCFVTSRSTTGYVYHAPTGGVTRDAFDIALSSIQAAAAPYKDVYIAYAYRGEGDSGYGSAIADLVGWGVPTDNIVEIRRIPLSNFGLNNFGQLGY